MNRFLTSCISIIAVLLVSESGYGYDLPEVLGVLYGSGQDTVRFGRKFCWVGDQNGDGYDDLLVQHDPRAYTDPAYHVNQVKMYFGGEEMDNEPDLIFTSEIEGEALGYGLVLIGRLTDDNSHWFAISSHVWTDGSHTESAGVYLFRGGEDLDTEPDITLRQPWEASGYFMSAWNQANRPTDINGDGYHDLILSQSVNDEFNRLLVFYGGADFDTIPDVIFGFDPPATVANFNTWSTGCDVNNDGYDDILSKTMYSRNEYLHAYRLFLGGSPMDTLPVVTIRSDWYYPDLLMEHGFALLPDVNNDGYDDWSIYYRRHSNEDDGFLLFYGSEEPDTIPDRDLQGTPAPFDHIGEICGGNFNGDEYNDVICSNKGGNMNFGAIMYYFGAPWMDYRHCMVLNGRNHYDRQFQRFGHITGAVGDYNGDGVDDFVTKIRNDTYGTLIVFAGNPDWEVNVKHREGYHPREISLSVSPNPFNSQVTISFNASINSKTKLSIYDLQGREVINLFEGRSDLKLLTKEWQCHRSGIYFVKLTIGDQNMVRKVVCVR